MMKRATLRFWLLALAIGYAAHLAADTPKLYVVALFKDRAVVMIDGTRRVLSIGERSPEGVELVQADSEQARFQVGDELIELALDGRVHAISAGPAHQPEVKIWRGRSGMFNTTGSINGLPVSFLVDTGATTVAMNSAQARRLGIDFRVEGDVTWVATASRTERAYAVTLDSVQVGDIRLHQVHAVVIDGPQPDEVLLGMSFLGRLEMDHQGMAMTLRKKF